MATVVIYLTLLVSKLHKRRLLEGANPLAHRQRNKETSPTQSILWASSFFTFNKMKQSFVTQLKLGVNTLLRAIKLDKQRGNGRAKVVV